MLKEYDISTAEDIHDALKDLLGGTIKSMMEAEMEEHLGYKIYERNDNTNSRNGSSEPMVVKKQQKDISETDDKIIAMYAKGLTTRQISEQIQDIYGFSLTCPKSAV